jgi:hypothetical protein
VIIQIAVPFRQLSCSAQLLRAVFCVPVPECCWTLRDVEGCRRPNGSFKFD